MKHGKLRNGAQPIPPNSVHLRQYTRPVPGRELDGLEFAAAVSPHAQIELIGAVVAANYRCGALEIAADIVGIRHGEGGRVQGDDRHIGNAENPLVAAAPRVLDDEVARQVLGLFERGRIGIRIRGGTGPFHGGRGRRRRRRR